jgi:hypothetical protein
MFWELLTNSRQSKTLAPPMPPPTRFVARENMLSGHFSIALRLAGFPTAIFLFLFLAFSGCATTDDYSFVRYGQTPDPATHQLDPTTVPALSDVLALNYASSVAAILRCKFKGARITREISSTAQVALAAAAGASAAFHYSATTVAALGLGSAGIPELQKIFDAKGRAQVYQDAVRLIEEAEIEYLSLNQKPSNSVLTQNGVTLFQRVTASIHVVEKTLAGNLPTVDDMKKATEAMSPAGAVKTTAGKPAVNNTPASGRVQKLAPVVIEKTVTQDVGLQPEQVRAITSAAGRILKKISPSQAQAVADKVGIVPRDGQDPREALSEELGDSSISAAKAADILKELQKQAPE